MIAVLTGRAAPVVSDPVPVTHWGIDEGLSPGQINVILQTQDGYLWFGSTEGLMRFDGVTCEVFNSRNTPEMKGSSVSALYEDRNHELWIGVSGAGGGVVRRTGAGQFKSYAKAEGLENEQIRAITEDATGTLWVGTDGGGLYALAQDRFQAFPGNPDLPSRFIAALLPAMDGGIWVGSQAHLCRVRAGVVVTNIATTGPIPKDSLVLLAGTNGCLLVGGSSGVLKLEAEMFSELDDKKGPDCCVQSLCYGAEGRLWIGTAFGLYRLEQSGYYAMTTENGLSGSMVSSVYRDREGSVWLASDVPGVDQIRFTRFSSLSVRQGLSHPITTSVCQDNQGTMWIGSHQGVNRYTNGVMTHWTTRDGLPANLVFSLCEDPGGGMWIGTYNGLAQFKDGQFKTFKQKDGLPSSIIWCLYTDREQRIWAGTHKGVVQIQDAGFHVFNGKTAGLSHDDVRAICQDAAGRLWVGTSYGLNRLENDRFVSYVNSTPDRPLDVVLALHPDRNGDLWIGTADRGLVLFRDGNFFSFTEEEGLFDNLVYAILEDDAGFLWMSCDRGIYRVSKAELDKVASGAAERVTCTVYGKADGLVSTECNGTVQPAAWRSRDGRLWFATTKGVAVIDPRNLPQNRVAPPVTIETVLADNTALGRIDGNQLPAKTRSLEFQYTAMSFVAPELVRFKYYLEGFDSSWLPPTQNRMVRYAQLPAGAYRFHVTACNNDGIWNEQGTSFAFTVVPAWWQTRWFIGLAMLVGAATIAGIVRIVTGRRYRKHLAELSRQNELAQERSRIARDMHDVLGSDLVKISMLGEIAEEESGQPALLRPRLQKIIQTARNAVRGMDEIVWAVNPKNDTLDNLATYLSQFAREHFELTKTRLHLDVPPNLPDVALRAELRHDLFLVVREALNNAVKHAGAADAWLRVGVMAGRLQIEIADNGGGMNPRPGGRRGNGLENMRTRILQHQGELEIQSTAGSGTTVRILLPLT